MCYLFKLYSFFHNQQEIYQKYLGYVSEAKEVGQVLDIIVLLGKS